MRRRRRVRLAEAALVRSRGGLTCKVHLASDERCRPPGVRAHAGAGRRQTDQAANRKKRGSAGGRPVSFDAVRYRDRNTVERCINKMKAWRGMATRYDKTPDSYMAGLQLRGSLIWIRSLRPAT